MIKYIKYYQYLKSHQKSVIEAGLEWDLDLSGHDKSRFRLDEFIPYARYLYGDHDNKKLHEPFVVALKLHHLRNDHHWQHYVQMVDGGYELTEIPENKLMEWLIDEKVSRTLDDPEFKIWSWWFENKHTLKIHPNTAKKVDTFMTDQMLDGIGNSAVSVDRKLTFK